jgi:hypothetical protein
MNIKFESSFAKDIRTIKDGKILSKLKAIIINFQQAESLG